jgi:hypothetical protein
MEVRLSASSASRPLPPGRFQVLISVRDWVDPRATVRLEGLGPLKNPMPLSGIEPATFRLVAWCPNQLHDAVTISNYTASYIRWLTNNTLERIWPDEANIPAITRREWGKPRRNSVTIASVQAEIRILHVQVKRVTQSTQLRKCR